MKWTMCLQLSCWHKVVYGKSGQTRQDILQSQMLMIALGIVMHMARGASMLSPGGSSW